MDFTISLSVMSKQTQHTAGPWHVANQVQIRSSRDQIAKIWMMRNGEGNANARLIAAAPELLEALEACLPTLEEREKTFGVESIPLGKARAVLAKAKGVQS